MKVPQRFLLAIILTASVISLAGCDAIKTISEYFKGSKTPKSADNSDEKTVMFVSDPNALIQVDEWSLSAKDFQQRLDALKEAAPDFDVTIKENRKAIAEELINQQALVKEAEQLGLINKVDIKAAIEEFRRTILIRELANEITKNISVSDEEIQKFFESQKQYMVTPMAWHIRAIIMDSKDEVNKVLADVLNGSDFAEQAKLHSKLPGASENGGDVGFITAEQIPFPELSNEILTLGVGDVSKVFQGPDGFYLIKLEAKRGGNPMAFSDVKEQIKANLLLQKQQDFMIKHTQELRGKSKITLNENLL